MCSAAACAWHAGISYVPYLKLTRLHSCLPYIIYHAVVARTQTARFSHLVGQEMGDSYGAAETVRDATFIDKRQPCARISQGPLWGQAYSRHVGVCRTRRVCRKKPNKMTRKHETAKTEPPTRYPVCIGRQVSSPCRGSSGRERAEVAGGGSL